MIYGLDMLYPPDPGAAKVMAAKGWTFCAVYVGGPRAAAHESWQQVDGWRYPVKAISQFFTSGMVPIYVGKNQPWDNPDSFTYEAGKIDGDDANRCTGACGFDSTTPLCLDVEYGTYQSSPGASEYIRGWVEQVNAAGHPAGIYSDPETLDNYIGHPESIDFVWGASWVRTRFDVAPVGRFNPASPPPWQLWQFGGGTIAGVSVDCNSAVDNFVFAKYSSAA